MSIENCPEMLSQQILVGRLGIPNPAQTESEHALCYWAVAVAVQYDVRSWCIATHNYTCIHT